MRLHVSPRAGGAALVLQLVSELRRRLDPSTGLLVLVDPDADAGAVRRGLTRIRGRLERTHVATMDFGSIFARDSALAAFDGKHRPVLLVPRKLPTGHPIRAEALERARAQEALGLRVVQSRLHWQGGNVIFDGETLAIGADAIAENVWRLGLTSDEVLRLLTAELGHEVTVLGDSRRGRLDEERIGLSPSGQASYHIDLDVALLGTVKKPTALVADERLGLRLLPAVLASDAFRLPHLAARRARDLVTREYRAGATSRAPRLQAYREALVERGYRVVSVPELRTVQLNEGLLGVADVTYCNVLPGLNRGRAALHYASWGIGPLDRAAAQSYREAGVQAIRVGRAADLASAMMQRAAGLRCFCGSMP